MDISIPCTFNHLIDLKQSIALTGLGTDRFDAAVRGIQTIHQVLSNHIFQAGGHLRDWTPGRDGQDLTLTFGNRYLTSARDIGNESSIDMSTIVDPLNILHPLMKTEVHTANNVVEYWECQDGDSTRYVLHICLILSVNNSTCMLARLM